jgi:hypothetical protein
MKVYFYIITITFFLTNCVSSIEAVRMQYDEYTTIEDIKHHFPIRIEAFDYTCMDTNFTVIGVTRSMPPRAIKIIKDFDFEIIVRIRNESIDLDWNRPLYAEIDRSVSGLDTVQLTAYGEALYSHMFYNIPFKFTATESERILFRLGFKHKTETDVIFAKPNDQFRTFGLLLPSKVR